MKKKHILLLTLCLLILLLVQPVHAQPVTVFVAPADIFQDIFGFLGSVLNGIINAIISIGEATIGAVVKVVTVLWEFGNAVIQALGIILNFIATIAIQLVNALLGLIGGLLIGIVSFLLSILQFILGIIQVIFKIIEIVALVISIVIQVAGIVIGWFFQAVGILFSIITGVNETPAQAIPGLPRCVSAPMDSQICAIWYIFDWTLLDGTPGSFIVPIITLIIDIGIVAYVISSVFKLIRWFQSLYEVV